MKNLYYIIALVLLSATGYAQQNLQNANWYFGINGGLTFLPDPNNPLPLTNNNIGNMWEACASVSDQSGNLQFYTQSVVVRNRIHGTMTNGNGLLGALSSSQGCVIIPRPGNINQYYLVTISGISEGAHGLHYTIVDMTTGNGEILTDAKNIVLRDHLGNDIDNDYDIIGNMSEKLTSTVHSNGVDYWLVTQIRDRIYSYLVTATGISLTPTAISPALLNVQPAPLDFSIFGIGHMKISPDTQRIGICYHNNDINGDYGAMALGDFNYATGEVTFDEELITVPGHYDFYGIEFSPNSQYAYFTTYHNVLQTDGRSENNTEYANIFCVPAGKSGNKIPKLIYSAAIPNNITTSQDIDPVPDMPYHKVLGLQLAINGRIYASRKHILAPVTHLSVINDPNNYDNPAYVDQSVLIGGEAALTLPQWVHWNDGSVCPAFIVLDTPETNTSLHYKYSNYIKTEDDYTIYNNQNITMQAGDHVLLKPDTHIKSGSQYHAFIEDCGETNNSTSKFGISANETTDAEVEHRNKLLATPNPTSGVLQLSGVTINQVIVCDLSGKVVYRSTYNNIDETSIDLSNLQQGMYFVKVTTDDEEIQTVKIIKN